VSTVDVYNLQREKVGQVELDARVFGAPVKEHLLWAVVRYQLAARRAGTHATKGRSDVAGGGKKPFKQKGTGRARQGSSRAPHMRGGGVVHGPQPRSHAFKINKKVRAAALRSALSRRASESRVTVLDTLALDAAKTKLVAGFMTRFDLPDMLVVVGPNDNAFALAARNIPRVTVLPAEGLNVYDVLRRNNLVITPGGLDAVTARLAG
jgi:large subunit ribosomal protein L4